MSEKMEKASQLIREEALKKIAGWIMGALAFAGIALFTPFITQASIVWNYPAIASQQFSDINVTLGEIKNAQENIRDEIQLIRKPARIFELSPYNTGPVNGECISRETCTFAIKGRRTPEGLRCSVIFETMRFYYINPRSDEVVWTHRTDDKPLPIFSGEWKTTEIDVYTPPELEPDADLFIEIAYRDCPNTKPEAEPIVDVSTPIRTLIRSEASPDASGQP